MAEVKCVKIKFVPTGNIFNIPQEEATEIFLNDRGNYEILDKNFVLPPENDVVETTTFEQVVEEDKADEQKDNKQELTYRDVIEKMKVSELIAYCDKNKIEYDKRAKKSDLIDKILASPVQSAYSVIQESEE